MQLCPKCGSRNIHRSRSRSAWEFWRKRITGKRTYRCASCGWRGWGVDSGIRLDEQGRRAADKAVAAKLKAGAAGERHNSHDELDPAALDVPSTELENQIKN